MTPPNWVAVIGTLLFATGIVLIPVVGWYALAYVVAGVILFTVGP